MYENYARVANEWLIDLMHPRGNFVHYDFLHLQYRGCKMKGVGLLSEKGHRSTAMLTTLPYNYRYYYSVNIELFLILTYQYYLLIDSIILTKKGTSNY